MFPSHILSKNNWSDALKKRERERENVIHIELNYVPFPNLVLSGGEGNLQSGGSLSRQKPCEILVAKNGGKRGEAGGKSQEKVQVTLFFFLETNSGWTREDARQFTKSQALLSHFSKPCNLEAGPQPAIASSSWASRFKCDKNQVSTRSPFIFFFFFFLEGGGLCQTLTHKSEASVNNSSC